MKCSGSAWLQYCNLLFEITAENDAFLCKYDGFLFEYPM